MARIKTNESNGVWKTVSGRRIFIAEGQTLSQAMAKSGKFELDDIGEQLEKEEVGTRDDFLQKYKISSSEVNSLKGYTNKNYLEINSELRENKGRLEKCSSEIQKSCQDIDQFLDKTPKYEGTVYRVEGDEIEYREGESYVNRSYTSASRELGSHLRKGKTIVELKDTHSGSEISILSERPEEKEVLFPRGLRFEVEKIETLSDGTKKVYAREVK